MTRKQNQLQRKYQAYKDDMTEITALVTTVYENAKKAHEDACVNGMKEDLHRLRACLSSMESCWERVTNGERAVQECITMLQTQIEGLGSQTELRSEVFSVDDLEDHGELGRFLKRGLGFASNRVYAHITASLERVLLQIKTANNTS